MRKHRWVGTRGLGAESRDESRPTTGRRSYRPPGSRPGALSLRRRRLPAPGRCSTSSDGRSGAAPSHRRRGVHDCPGAGLITRDLAADVPALPQEQSQCVCRRRRSLFVRGDSLRGAAAGSRACQLAEAGGVARRRTGPGACCGMTRPRRLPSLGQDHPVRGGARAAQRRRGPTPGALVRQRARERPRCVAQRPWAARAGRTLHFPREELLRLHVVLVRTAGV
jgi:hypothetical protein